MRAGQQGLKAIPVAPKINKNEIKNKIQIHNTNNQFTWNEVQHKLDKVVHGKNKLKQKKMKK